METIGDVSGWVHDKGMKLYRKTDNIRGPVGYTIGAIGGGLFVAGLATNPAGWAVGTGLVLAEVGGILVISDMDVWGTAEKVVEPVKAPLRDRNKEIEDIANKGLEGIKEKDSH